jgi:hypothetical protein
MFHPTPNRKPIPFGKKYRPTLAAVWTVPERDCSDCKLGGQVRCPERLELRGGSSSVAARARDAVDGVAGPPSWVVGIRG